MDEHMKAISAHLKSLKASKAQIMRVLNEAKQMKGGAINMATLLKGVSKAHAKRALKMAHDSEMEGGAFNFMNMLQTGARKFVKHAALPLYDMIAAPVLDEYAKENPELGVGAKALSHAGSRGARDLMLGFLGKNEKREAKLNPEPEPQQAPQPQKASQASYQDKIREREDRDYEEDQKYEKYRRERDRKQEEEDRKYQDPRDSYYREPYRDSYYREPQRDSYSYRDSYREPYQDSYERRPTREHDEGLLKKYGITGRGMNQPRSRSVGSDMLSPMAAATMGHSQAMNMKNKLERNMAEGRRKQMGLLGVSGNLLGPGHSPALMSQPQQNFQFRHTISGSAYHPHVYGNGLYA
jgi:hypothetical protein